MPKATFRAASPKVVAPSSSSGANCGQTTEWPWSRRRSTTSPYATTLYVTWWQRASARTTRSSVETAVITPRAASSARRPKSSPLAMDHAGALVAYRSAHGSASDASSRLARLPVSKPRAHRAQRRTLDGCWLGGGCCSCWRSLGRKTASGTTWKVRPPTVCMVWKVRRDTSTVSSPVLPVNSRNRPQPSSRASAPAPTSST